MRGEQINHLPEEVARAQGSEKLKDRAELLFDSIMKDVRDQRKAGKDVTFKTHKDYETWLGLRNQNMESTPITPAQHAAAKERQKAEFENNPNNRRIAADQDNVEKAQAKYTQERAAQEAAEKSRKEEMEGLSIDRFYKDGKRIDSSARASKEQARSLLSGKKESALNVSGRLVEGGFEGEEVERQIRSIVKDMEQLKNVYSVQIKSLEGMGLMDRILGRRAALENQMAETQAEVLLRSQALIKEFKVSGKVLSNQDAIVERLWDLSKKLENRISVGEAAVALVVLTSVIAGCGGELVKKVSAADSFRAPAMVFQDGSSDSDSETSVSPRFESKVAGFRASQEPVYASADSGEDSGKVVGGREVYKLTADEANKVKGFSGWRKMILNPEFIGKLQKDGTIPTTEKGLNTAIGTKVLIDMDGKILKEMVVEKGSSIWEALQENKDEINGLAKENGGFGKLGLEIITPKLLEDKGETGLAKSGGKGGKVGKRQTSSGVERTQPVVEEPVDPELDRANNAEVSAKLLDRGVKHSLGRDYHDSAGYDAAIDELAKLQKGEKDLNVKHTVAREINRLKDSKAGFLKKSGLEKSAATKILAERGVGHIVGTDYGTTGEYDNAIEALKNIDSALGEDIGVVIDMQESDIQRDLAKAKRGVESEIARLEEARKDLRVSEHQGMIDQEAKIPQVAAPEKMEFAQSVGWEQMAKEDEIKLRADKYTDVMLRAYNIISRVDLVLSGDVDEEQMRAFQDDAISAKKIYSDLLKPGMIDDKFAAKKFIVKQCEIGLKIAEKNIKIADNALPKENVKNVVDSAKNELDVLVESNKMRTGNTALFGEGGALETVQLVVGNIFSTGKFSNIDKKQLRKVKKDLHAVLNSKNNLPNDYVVADKLLGIIGILNKGVSKKDQDTVDAVPKFPSGVRYEAPKLPEQTTAKNLDKLLSDKVKNQIDEAYELAGKLADETPSSAVASDLVNAASLLEHLLLRPMEAVDIQDKLDRAEDLILKTQAKVENSKIYPTEYGHVLNQLNSAFTNTRDSLIKSNVLEKQVAPAARSGKRVADGK